MSDKPKVLPSAIQAWIDVKNAASAMPLLVGIGLAIFAVNQIAESTLLPRRTDSLAGIAADALLTVVANFFQTPLYIAIHRFIILGEATDRYAINFLHQRFFLFFFWTTALQLFFTVTNVLSLAQPNVLFLIAMFVLVFAAFILSIRLMLLFPAIAVDAPGATWQNAMQDTSGHFWRIVGIVICALLPIMAFALIIMWISSSGVAWINWLSGAVSAALLVAVASRLYMSLGNFVNREGQVPV